MAVKIKNSAILQEREIASSLALLYACAILYRKI
jgi:hypothetical protein